MNILHAGINGNEQSLLKFVSSNVLGLSKPLCAGETRRVCYVFAISIRLGTTFNEE